MTRALVVLLALAGVASADRARPPSGEIAGLRDPFADPRERPTVRPALPRVVVAREMAELGKTIAGTYKCTGAFDKLAIKVELDNAWIVVTRADRKEYRTYDAVAKQWTRIALATTPAYTIETSLGADHGTWTWESATVRDHERIDDKKLELSGEVLRSGTWQKTHEATCTR